jgi:FAD-dependent oxidoreductase domain-containing protein 1
MLKKVDVLVIGGGAIGASISASLKLLSDKLTVTCIERDPSYTYASSALSVGSIRQQFSLPENVNISQYGIDFIHALSQDPENSVQFDSGGYAFLSTSENGAKQLRENVQVQRDCGANVKLFGTGAAFQEHFPWCNVDDVTEATLGSPGEEGWFDPFTLTTALKRRAVASGANFIEGEVCKIDCSNVDGNSRTVEKVYYRNKEGEISEIKGGIVINAAGCWSQGILDLALGGNGCHSEAAGRILPVVAKKRNVFVVHCPTLLEPSVPLLVDTSGMYVRREGDPSRGLYLCGGMESKHTDDPDCIGTEDELVVDHDLWMNHLWPALAYRIPAFEECKVTSSWAGFYDYNTFDQNALLGLLPEFNNFHTATGFSGHGIQQAAAVGNAMAELIVHGEYREIDLSRFNASRVVEGKPIYEQNIV